MKVFSLLKKIILRRKTEVHNEFDCFPLSSTLSTSVTPWAPWQNILKKTSNTGYLHDYDYQEFPEEHLQHSEKELLAQGVSEEDVRAVLSHGFEIVNEIEPKTNMEKSLILRRSSVSSRVMATN